MTRRTLKFMPSMTALMVLYLTSSKVFYALQARSGREGMASALPRIEHAQILQSRDPERIGRLGGRPSTSWCVSS